MLPHTKTNIPATISFLLKYIQTLPESFVGTRQIPLIPPLSTGKFWAMAFEPLYPSQPGGAWASSPTFKRGKSFPPPRGKKTP